ncbi:hypothetical protein MTR_7g088750 [Medicago truncatula]|uniref:Uncharacterized protein n=1 Tax=Medicago truncatula TaxID=3880 RepID=G7L4U6_MEDTR|nr:hypothetical protein MTR_7g088750 [Medicago truncatula]
MYERQRCGCVGWCEVEGGGMATVDGGRRWREKAVRGKGKEGLSYKIAPDFLLLDKIAP